MLTYNEAFYGLTNCLQPLYDEQEARAISHEVLEYITGLSKLERLTEKDKLLTAQQQEVYDRMQQQLILGEPLQYVTSTAWFMNRRFIVNKHVLIPRPETEELVEWVIDDQKELNGSSTLLDIGTGSGCIPISIKLALKGIRITSCDISEEALAVARKNADALNADIQFVHADFLSHKEWEKFNTYNVIVSNPPYIPERERVNIHINVKDFEPSVALFAPDDDPLIFYKAIAAFGKKHLNEHGSIYCELHADHAQEAKKLFEAMGYKHVEIRRDLHGNWRMLKAIDL